MSCKLLSTKSISLWHLDYKKSECPQTLGCQIMNALKTLCKFKHLISCHISRRLAFWYDLLIILKLLNIESRCNHK